MAAIPQPNPQSGLSALFSLSNAAAEAPPIPVPAGAADKSAAREREAKDLASGKNGSHMVKHRRLSSTSQARRRMSDAREAAVRPRSVFRPLLVLFFGAVGMRMAYSTSASLLHYPSSPP